MVPRALRAARSSESSEGRYPGTNERLPPRRVSRPRTNNGEISKQHSGTAVVSPGIYVSRGSENCSGKPFARYVLSLSVVYISRHRPAIVYRSCVPGIPNRLFARASSDTKRHGRELAHAAKTLAKDGRISSFDSRESRLADRREREPRESEASPRNSCAEFARDGRMDGWTRHRQENR